MPFVSDAQRKYFNANRAELEKQGVNVGHWNEESRGLKLPARARAGGGGLLGYNELPPAAEEVMMKRPFTGSYDVGADIGLGRIGSGGGGGGGKVTPFVRQDTKSDFPESVQGFLRELQRKRAIERSNPNPRPSQPSYLGRIFDLDERALGGAAPQMAFGGLMPGPNPPGLQSRGAFKGAGFHKGPIPGNTMGRGDKVGMGVAPGSYVLPADHVSGLGQGNTAAGFKVLNAMFTKGPYGTDIAKIPHGGSTLPKMGVKQKIADGGEVLEGAMPDMAEPVEIQAADGEYVVTPDQIMNVWGDLEKGHRALDEWVLYERRNHINKLKSLPGPVKN